MSPLAMYNFHYYKEFTLRSNSDDETEENFLDGQFCSEFSMNISNIIICFKNLSIVLIYWVHLLPALDREIFLNLSILRRVCMRIISSFCVQGRWCTREVNIDRLCVDVYGGRKRDNLKFLKGYVSWERKSGMLFGNVSSCWNSLGMLDAVQKVEQPMFVGCCPDGGTVCGMVSRNCEGMYPYAGTA